MRFFVSTQSQLLVASVLALLAVLALVVLALLAMRGIAELLGKTPESNLVCRNCKSRSIHASRPLGFIDTLFELLACMPYRCDVCSYRFYIRRPMESARVSTSLR